ncbi:hypothetical protein [Thermogemmata fonticola]|jgi:hypothetical protein|uniref:Uncharacterized protein n=1 Tax=Thermogemmata fonticola TaxID=2755323 RepID=A0A7V8VCY6_9BACT|nr:hypothetical protein [Thermogemmata fonticola]MBA2225749.1 hypothetical protein [Thermogemmata fonticola]
MDEPIHLTNTRKGQQSSSPPPVRWVCYEICYSFMLATVVCRSRPVATHSWKQRLSYGIGYSLLALLLGPWGIPWGIFHTLRILWLNLTGGIDVTPHVSQADNTTFIVRASDGSSLPSSRTE